MSESSNFIHFQNNFSYICEHKIKYGFYLLGNMNKRGQNFMCMWGKKGSALITV